MKVLSGLRDWEICAPDVSAAVEFCREKVVEQSVKEFERWFHEQFPSISRPSPIPLPSENSSTQGNHSWIQSSNESRNVKSAPPRMRQIKAGVEFSI